MMIQGRTFSWMSFGVLAAFGTAALLLAPDAGADGMAEKPPGAVSSAGSQLSGGAAQPVSKAGVANTGATPRGKTDPLKEFDLARYQYCGQDSDCVSAMNSCCDCANGGQEVAVNKERLADFQANFDCLYVACGAEQPPMPCLSGVVSCVEHRCRYIPEAEPMDRM